MPKARPAAGTLVVCPTSVLRQWAEKLRNKVASKAKLTFLVYRGSNRTKDPDELAKYDVVLTTYAIVSMEVPKELVKDAEEKGVRWFRVVLDEAQCIKNHRTHVAWACYHLSDCW